MDVVKILLGADDITLEEVCRAHENGYEFVIEDGMITEVLC